VSRKEEVAQRFIVSGRVQGVGYRFFVERAAEELGLRGYARNLGNGDVEVYAIGNSRELSELAGRLRAGPRFADVRHVDAQDAAMIKCFGFHIE
jgi:acylphosphatase